MPAILDGRPWIMQRADPYVLLSPDGWYFFLATVPEYDRIVIRRANSLEALPHAPETVVWWRHDRGPMSKHVWAPEMHWLDGKWYIYFAAGEQEDPWKIRPYVLVCDSSDPLTGAWAEGGMVQAAPEDAFSFRDFSLDMTVFTVNSRRYCVWAEKVNVGKKISNLYIAEMATPTRLKTAQVLLTTPDYVWERQGYWVNEGPAVFQHAGMIFLTYSASETGACYCMGMLTARQDADLLDPRSWRKQRDPVFASNEQKRIFGPGHNSFTTDAQGRDILVFHARDYEAVAGDPLEDPNRHARLCIVQWDERGNPLFA
jgi:GH43 family beta-xylosidase